MDLGRFQAGQVVTVGVTTLDSGGSPATPDAAPAATVKDPGGNTVWSGKLPMAPGAYPPTAFALPVFVGVGYSLGTYTVSYTWAVGAFNGTASDTFTVIGGGDVGGRVISLYAYGRPEARFVVAQLSSGNTIQGRNPRL
jgi:hypothetical protein